MRFLLCALIGLMIGAAGASAQSVIGTTSEARGQITARGIGGKVRTLNLGAALKQNDTLSTGPDGIAELLFLDQTVMMLVPDSELRLDEFVYQPAGGDKFLTTLAVGTARFFSGVQPKAAYAVQTPNATIGIRGTIFDVMVGRDQVTTVVLRRGIVALRNRSGVTRTIRTPNLASTARRADQPPSKPARINRNIERKTRKLNELTPAKVSARAAKQVKTQAQRAKSASRTSSSRLKKTRTTQRNITSSVKKSTIKASVLRSTRLKKTKSNASKSASKR